MHTPLGIGFGMVIISYLGSISYNVIMGWSFYFLFASWQTVLPWSTCTQDYNTPSLFNKFFTVFQKHYGTFNIVLLKNSRLLH